MHDILKNLRDLSTFAKKPPFWLFTFSFHHPKTVDCKHFCKQAKIKLITSNLLIFVEPYL
jgi:hypothetical protein